MNIDITDIGVPPGSHQTCRKISTLTGPLFRDGGFYIVENQNLVVCVLQQIYKLEDGEYLPVAEILDDVSRRFHRQLPRMRSRGEVVVWLAIKQESADIHPWGRSV